MNSFQIISITCFQGSVLYNSRTFQDTFKSPNNCELLILNLKTYQLSYFSLQFESFIWLRLNTNSDLTSLFHCVISSFPVLPFSKMFHIKKDILQHYILCNNLLTPYFSYFPKPISNLYKKNHQSFAEIRNGLTKIRFLCRCNTLLSAKILLENIV